MVHSAEILARLDHERRTLARTGEEMECLPEVTRLRIGGQHLVSWSSLSVANADAVIAREVAHFGALGVPVEWKVYAHDTPDDLGARLARHGFTIGPCEAVMVCDLATRPAWAADEPRVHVERLSRELQLDDFRHVLQDVFGDADDALLAELTLAMRSGSTEHLAYVAYAGGEPASVGRLYSHPASAFGGLYGGSTRARFRGQGFYRATVAARARDALALGAKYLLVDALPTSRPILEGLGFVQLTETWPCEFTP